MRSRTALRLVTLAQLALVSAGCASFTGSGPSPAAVTRARDRAIEARDRAREDDAVQWYASNLMADTDAYLNVVDRADRSPSWKVEAYKVAADAFDAARAHARAVTAVLERELPGFSQVTTNDYPPDVLEWCDVVPAIEDDFDGNGFPDLALLLKKETGPIILVAVNASAEGFAVHTLNDEVDDVPTRTTLEIEQPGRTYQAPDAPEDTKYRVFLERPGIGESLIETCHHMLYYWEDGRYESLYLGL